MANPTAAMLAIGDEILSGRTKDKNISWIAEELSDIGIDLEEVRIIPDKPEIIIASVNHLRAHHSMLFTSGGLGPTHDDLTSEAISEAFCVDFKVRDDARRILEDFHKENMNDEIMRMARIPGNAKLILNSVSGAPGYIIENVYVMAGVPQIFRAMFNSIKASLKKGMPLISSTVKIYIPESRISECLRDMSHKFRTLQFGSYPFQENGKYGTSVVIKGKDESGVMEAEKALLAIYFNHTNSDSAEVREVFQS